MNFLLSLSSLEILMLDVQNGAIKTLPTQLAVRLTLLHLQQDINNLSTNQLISQATLLLASILFFVTTRI